MRIAFIQLPHVSGRECRPPTLYPLGLGYLASVISIDHRAIPVDLWQDPLSPSKAAQLPILDKCDAFCISAYSTQYLYLRALVRALHTNHPGVPVIVGGPGATHSYPIFLQDAGVDYCVLGEGEITLPDLLANLSTPRPMVKGIAYLVHNGTQVRVTPEREQIRDISSLPFPDRHIFNSARYIEQSQKEEGLLKGYRSTNLIAGRGCPYSCTFCSKGFAGCRIRSASDIMKEVAYLRDNFRLNAVEFNDELVITSKERILQLCRALRPLEINWGCQGRINLMDREVLEAMKRAGCLYIGYGVESYTQRILDAMHKHVRVERILPVIKATRAAGIKPVIQYMFGFPGEDDQSLVDTRRFFQMANVPYIGMVTLPLPGTQLYEQARLAGQIENEEQYLLKLSAGYNSPTPLVSLTGWSVEELYEKHEALTAEVNTQYYRRHPWLKVRQTSKRILHRALRQTRKILGGPTS